MFSSTSFAEWTKTTENVNKTVFYVDFERIRKHDGYVYYWDLSDRIRPLYDGTLSAKRYIQGDCKLFRFKTLSYVFHKQPMGRDVGQTLNEKNPEWRYPPPKTGNEATLKYVCLVGGS